MKFTRYALTLILCILMAFTCVLSVAAENIKYDLDELKMSIEIPDSMSVRTRENSTDLADSIYLEAVSADSSLSISVSMIENEKTQEIYTFKDLPSSTLEEYKEQMLQNDGYIECKSGTYGTVPFLDFSQKYTTETGVEIYGKQSVTLVNGMSISITSQSAGDSFTSDELNLIKGCLDSISFKSIKTSDEGVSFWTVLLWIGVIIILLGVAFVAFSYYMGKRSADKKREAHREKHRKADYDVLKNAEGAKPAQYTGGKVSGYKTSSDYFDNGFDAPTASKNNTAEASPAAEAPTAAEKAVRSTRRAFTHVGYFFSNMKREIKGSKKSKSKGNNSKKTSKSSAKRRRQSRDYDVFND